MLHYSTVGQKHTLTLGLGSGTMLGMDALCFSKKEARLLSMWLGHSWGWLDDASRATSPIQGWTEEETKEFRRKIQGLLTASLFEGCL